MDFVAGPLMVRMDGKTNGPLLKLGSQEFLLFERLPPPSPSIVAPRRFRTQACVTNRFC